MKNKYHIGIGISGGIAGYKIVDLITSLKSKNIKSSVIMTENAFAMFGADLFENASGNKVFQNIIPSNFNYRRVLKDKKVEHISLADSLDLLLIAPATANIMAKLAHGFADDYLTTLTLSATCPKVIAPSMNTNMWHNASTQNNRRLLIAGGYYFINPDFGDLACGYQGIGRLRNIDEIENTIFDLLEKKDSLKGKKILITAGGTSVPIDSVRLITNRASGKMGRSLAECAFKRGAQVLLLRAQNAVSPNINIPEEIFQTAEELSGLLAKNCPFYDIIFHSASVSDFYPGEKFKGKLDSSKTYNITLVPGEKIIQKIKKINPEITLVGFKAELGIKETDIKNAGEKLFRESLADYVIINDVGRSDIGFASDYNEVYLLSSNGKQLKIPKKRKEYIAEKIIDEILLKYPAEII